MTENTGFESKRFPSAVHSPSFPTSSDQREMKNNSRGFLQRPQSCVSSSAFSWQTHGAGPRTVRNGMFWGGRAGLGGKQAGGDTHPSRHARAGEGRSETGNIKSQETFSFSVVWLFLLLLFWRANPKVTNTPLNAIHENEAIIKTWWEVQEQKDGFKCSNAAKVFLLPPRKILLNSTHSCETSSST